MGGVIYDIPTNQVLIRGEAIILQEATLNSSTNAATHGGPDLSMITLTLRCEGGQDVLADTDDGVGIPADKHINAISGYRQAGSGQGGRAVGWGCQLSRG
ncbi:MAG: ATP-binding protein [Tateyamaria sp.]|uniref:ATP-binding protein n=1 Tax=Tateyamaria sp. TaxID=1929288 RepID=UPI00329DF79D